MKRDPRLLLALILTACGIATGCESTGGNESQLNGGTYYGMGYYDPWYYGESFDPPEDSIRPPPDAPRPSHPIALPPGGGSNPRPMPTIPTMSRPSFRR